MPSPSPPPSSPIPRVRVSPILLLFFALSASTPASASPKVSYSDHCAAIVPESPSTGPVLDHSISFVLSTGYFSGAAALLGDPDPASPFPGFFYFHAWSVHGTTAPGVLKLFGTLNLRSAVSRSGRNLAAVGFRDPDLHSVRVRPPRFPRFSLRRSRIVFELSGFWDELTGRLCMVGTGTASTVDGTNPPLTAVFKAKYPNSSSINSSLVYGSIESLDDARSPNHFSSISILAYSQKDYDYTLIPEAEKSCSKFEIEEKTLQFTNGSFCSQMDTFFRGPFQLDYDHSTNCSEENCGPFGKGLGFVPRFMSFNQFSCSEDGKAHFIIGFSNFSSSARTPPVPGQSLVAEGVWDRERSRLCLAACRIRGLEDSSVGDCGIGMSLWFPSTFSIESRSTVVGRLWSEKERNDSGYFPVMPFWTLDSKMDAVQGLKYNYTRLLDARKSCALEKNSWRGESFPSGNSIEDMRFQLTVRDATGRRMWGAAIPLSVGEDVFGNTFLSSGSSPMAAPILSDANRSQLNVSYRITFNIVNTSFSTYESIEISAEGVYNPVSGMLCMVGCSKGDLSAVSKSSVKSADQMDCEIGINIQLPPLGPVTGGHLSGKIWSTRKNSDPRYFLPIKISSYGFYRKQAVESIWRMDIEITMVMVSLSLLCVFIGFQIFYVRKNPDVLPSASIVMLVILTLGYMIPLVLNFEALFFMNRNRQNVLSWSGGWLEANEVVVRVVTMVAFLLQFRFLQLSLSSKSMNGSKLAFWNAERKVLCLCLPLYFVGGFVAWFVHSRSHENDAEVLGFSASRHSVWEDLISYAGLILDGFLLPQIIFNIFGNVKTQVLTPTFYVGTTFVRAMPHLYDAYRSHYYGPSFKSSFIYANPSEDLYSFVWDIIVPLEGVLLAVLIYLQQRFGGSCILPPRFRKYCGYETVPASSG